jgi:putative endonuclease
LQKLGYQVVARNYRTRNKSAEVDLVAWDGEVLVFIEVKSRSSEDFGSPDRAVDADKQRNLQRAAAEYVRRSDLKSDIVRFDVVSVIFGSTASSTVINHITDAFSRNRSL